MSYSLTGRVLLNRYRVDEFIASGGMADVYRAWDTWRNVTLAMKVLHYDLAEDPAILKRFMREVNALKKLTHPNIPPFFGADKTSHSVFLLEHFIDGPTLKYLLDEQQKSPMPKHEMLIYLKALSAALGYAHANGVVHCDVKPGNVMIDQGGNIYLTDFGIARHADSTTTTLVGAGTAGYMAPEQIKGDAVNPATDVYALGVMLYEMLTGRRPFRGDEKESENAGVTADERVRYGHRMLAPPDPRMFNPSLTGEISQVILKAIAKDPTQRYQSVRDLYVALCTAMGFQPETIPDRVIPSKEYWKDKELPTEGEETRGGRDHKWTAWVIGGFLLVVAVIFISTLVPDILPMPTPTRTLAIITKIVVVDPDAGLDMATKLHISPTPSSTTLPRPTSTPVMTQTPNGSKRISTIDGVVLVYIPAGEFIMGLDSADADYLYYLCSDECTNRDIFDASQPLHNVNLDGYWIDRTEVSNERYQKCVIEGACTPPHKHNSNTRDLYYSNVAYNQYPVVWVDWSQANQYCQWVDGYLPTEAQWEKAARGIDGRLFPWGNKLPNPKLTNANKWEGDTKPVESYPDGGSVYGILNMAGNVYEWVADWYDPDYYRENQNWVNPIGPLTPDPTDRRSVRGGNFSWGIAFVSSGIHDWWEAYKSSDDVGFRCAYDETLLDR